MKLMTKMTAQIPKNSKILIFCQMCLLFLCTSDKLRIHGNGLKQVFYVFSPTIVSPVLFAPCRPRIRRAGCGGGRHTLNVEKNMKNVEILIFRAFPHVDSTLRVHGKCRKRVFRCTRLNLSPPRKPAQRDRYHQPDSSQRDRFRAD